MALPKYTWSLLSTCVIATIIIFILSTSLLLEHEIYHSILPYFDSPGHGSEDRLPGSQGSPEMDFNASKFTSEYVNNSTGDSLLTPL